MFDALGSVLRLGARISLLECVVAHFLPLLYLFLSPLDRSWLLDNAVAQAATFVPIAIIPALLKQRMAFVDIAWPLGLVLIGMQGLSGTGFWLAGAWLGKYSYPPFTLGDLTVLGQRMAEFPLEPVRAKVLFVAERLGVLVPCAAVLRL